MQQLRALGWRCTVQTVFANEIWRWRLCAKRRGVTLDCTVFAGQWELVAANGVELKRQRVCAAWQAVLQRALEHTGLLGSTP